MAMDDAMSVAFKLTGNMRTLTNRGGKTLYLVQGPPSFGFAEIESQAIHLRSGLIFCENQTCIGSAKPETVRHHSIEIGVIYALTRNRHIFGTGIDFLNIS